MRPVAAVVVLLLLLAGCAGAPGADGRAPLRTRVDVDTPALRAQKAAAGIAPCEPGTGAPPPDRALPAVTLPCLGGGPDVELARLRGPLVVNLWAQWCAPCREELPYFQRLHEQPGVDVLGIDYLDTRPDGALALAAATGVRYPLLADPAGELRDDLRLRGLPAMVFVDAAGRVSAVVRSPVESYAELAVLAERHLGVDVGAAG